MNRWQLGFLSLVLLFFVSCSNNDAQIRERADRARAEAAVGTSHYASFQAAVDTKMYVMRSLLCTEQYDGLEELLRRAETDGEDQGHYNSALQLAYSAFDEGKYETQGYLDYYVKRWIESSPDSKYPRLVQASMRSRQILQLSDSWRNLTDYQELGARATEAAAALMAAQDNPRITSDPEYWESKERVALVFNTSTENVEQMMQETLKRDPERWSACALRVYRDDPKWAQGTYPRMLRTADRLAEQYGPEAYAVSAWEMFLHKFRADERFAEIGFDPDKIDAGFRALREKHPESKILPSMQARLAVALGRQKEAASLLTELGDDWSRVGFWDSDKYFKTGDSLGVEPAAREASLLKVGPEREWLEKGMQSIKLREECGELLDERRFGALELVAAKCRMDESKLGTFYGALDRAGNKAETEIMLGICDSWKEAFPASVTVDVVRADNLRSAAWDARGGGYAASVSEDGWKLFRKYLEEAKSLLQTLPDTHACDSRMWVAIGLSEPEEVIHSLVEQAAKLNPKALEPLRTEAIYWLPRWHGSHEALGKFFDRVQKERGEGVLWRLVSRRTYRQAFYNELSYDFYARSLSAETDKDDPEFLSFRFVLEFDSRHREKAAEALKAAREKNALWEWDAGVVNGYETWIKGGPYPLGTNATLLDAGEYSGILPEPKKVAPPGACPLIKGRSLGIKLKYKNDVDFFILRRIRLISPDNKVETRYRYFPPGAIKAGEQEIVWWDFWSQDRVPGVWTLSVSDNNSEVVSQKFHLLSSDAPPEPGARIRIQGMVKHDPATGSYAFEQETRRVPCKMGSNFGALVDYTFSPEKVFYDWVWQRDGKEMHDSEEFQVNGFPGGRFTFFLEKPEEIAPGPWNLHFTLNERPIGAIPFVLE